MSGLSFEKAGEAHLPPTYHQTATQMPLIWALITDGTPLQDRLFHKCRSVHLTIYCHWGRKNITTIIVALPPRLSGVMKYLLNLYKYLANNGAGNRLTSRPWNAQHALGRSCFSWFSFPPSNACHTIILLQGTQVKWLLYFHTPFVTKVDMFSRRKE